MGVTREGLEKRAPVSDKFVDLSGTVTPHGVKITSFEGFKNRIAIYSAVCPLCESTFLIRSNAAKRQLSCGCAKSGSPGECERHVIYMMWHASIDRMCKPWRSFSTFWEECGRFIRADERLFARIPSAPISIANMVLLNRETCGKGHSSRDVFKVRANDQDWFLTRTSAAKLLGMTRAGVHHHFQTNRARLIEMCGRKLDEIIAREGEDSVSQYRHRIDPRPA